MHLILCMLGLNDSILHHQFCDALYLLWVIQYPKALVMNYNVLVQHHTLADTNLLFSVFSCAEAEHGAIKLLWMKIIK